MNPLEQPPVVLVSRVKSSDKKEASGKEAYKRVKTWPISELKSVDGRTAEAVDFDLQFERQVYKWVASSVAEKKNFITAIYKVRIIFVGLLYRMVVPALHVVTYCLLLQAVHKYVEHKKPNFLNVDEDRLKQLLLTSTESKKRSAGEPEDEIIQKG